VGKFLLFLPIFDPNLGIFVFVKVGSPAVYCVLSVSLRCVCVQYDNSSGDTAGAAGGNSYSYWPNQRHQPMPGPPGVPPHQLAGASVLEYRPPPRRGYPPGHGHAAVVPVMTDELGLGSLML